MQFPTNGRISDRKECTLLLDIENLSEFAREAVGNSRHSEKVYINGFSWKILAQIKTKNGSTDNEKWLGFFFSFDTTKKDSHWRCCVGSATFRIISHRKEAENSNGTFCDRVFDNKSTGWGFENFFSFAELLDPRNGFYSGEDYKSDVPDFRKELSEERTYNSKSNNWGFPNFISFAELMDPSKGFYDKSEDKVILAIDFRVKEAKTAEKP
ncbi:hypothetical protein niasHT_036789 [Heterodera trifolii]|uniref:MATH domain-containing protein n=1 Tax=Heterodera trifolii TaxID=157864 RepID=A0ABD2IWG3_9BILA